MVNGDRRQQRREDLARRADEQEPLVDTPVLDMWAELDAPLRGDIRENVINRLRMQVKGRRTVEGIAGRIASNVTTPVTSAIQSETEERVKKNVQEALERQAERGRDGN